MGQPVCMEKLNGLVEFAVRRCCFISKSSAKRSKAIFAVRLSFIHISSKKIELVAHIPFMWSSILAFIT